MVIFSRLGVAKELAGALWIVQTPNRGECLSFSCWRLGVKQKSMLFPVSVFHYFSICPCITAIWIACL